MGVGAAPARNANETVASLINKRGKDDAFAASRLGVPFSTLYIDMKIKIVNRSRHALPQYATPLSAGLDLRANLDEPVVLQPMERRLIPTGLYIALPEGYEAQIRPRSGLAIRHGISLVNSPGTIDADYRGEIGIILINLSAEPFTVNDGERICQMVVARHASVEWQPSDNLAESNRGDGGFGHTGIK